MQSNMIKIFIIYYVTALKETAAEAYQFISEIYSESALSVKACEY